MVSRAIVREPISLLELRKQEAVQGRKFICSPLLALDDVLRGGFHRGQLIEVCGRGGAGKSQLCLTSAVLAVADPGERSVVYIDTEGKFSAERIAEIIHNRNLDRRIADRIMVMKAENTSKIFQILESLEVRFMFLITFWFTDCSYCPSFFLARCRWLYWIPLLLCFA